MTGARETAVNRIERVGRKQFGSVARGESHQRGEITVAAGGHRDRESPEMRLAAASSLLCIFPDTHHLRDACSSVHVGLEVSRRVGGNECYWARIEVLSKSALLIGRLDEPLSRGTSLGDHVKLLSCLTSRKVGMIFRPPASTTHTRKAATRVHRTNATTGLPLCTTKHAGPYSGKSHRVRFET